VLNCIMLKNPVVQDDDWFYFWLDIIGLTKQCYDFEADKWVHLPFSGGLFEQADVNPFLWTAINFIIDSIKARLRINA